MEPDSYIERFAYALERSGKRSDYAAACVNYATRLVQNKLPVIFDLNHFCLLLGTNKQYISGLIFCPEHQYKEVFIPKKNGTDRRLLIPSASLKYIQRWILDNMLSKMRMSEFATGFKKNTSILINASKHLNKECIVSFDILNFFPSICFETVFKIFYYYGYSKEISFILSRLCTFEDSLPQGSPASPCISNIACLRLDKRISSLAFSYNAVYSRYADDITISGNCGVINCMPIVGQIIKEEGFNINHKKTRISYAYQRQEVTGLNVNSGKVKVNKNFKRSFMQEIYYCLKFGVDNHLEYIGCHKKFYKEHLYGKAYFLLMIEPDTGKRALQMLDDIKWDY